MKKFSAGGAQGRYERRMADIEKDFKKAMARKTGKDAEVAEAKRQQRIADAKDDLAKRTGADRTATRAAERLAESNLTKTRKYGAPKAVTAEAPTPSAKITDTLGPITAPKSGISNAPTKKVAARPIAKTTPKPVADAPAKTTKTDFRNVRGGSNSGSPTKPLAATPFDREAFTDLKAARARFEPTNSQSPTMAKMRALAEAPGASRAQIQDYRRALRSGMYAKGGKVKDKGFSMMDKKKKSMPPQPTAAERARSKAQLDSLKKAKVSPEEAKVIQSANRSEGPGYKKGGKMASCGMKKGGKATKFGAAMKKKSADTKGRAMMKYAKGGSIDGCATKGKTKGRMV